MREREVEVIHLEAVGPIAHAVLDAEVDAETDEQHRERDRDQVERPDHQESKRRRYGKTGDQIEKYRKNDPPGLQREIEDTEHDQHGGQAVDDHALLHGRELLVRDRYWSGQAHPRPIVLRQLEIGYSLTNRCGRCMAGLQ